MAEDVSPDTPAAATLDSPPVAGQTVHHNGKEFTTIKEGLAYILVPTEAAIAAKQKRDPGAIESQAVFYNPIQQFNRDLTVLAIKAFGEDVISVRQSQAERRKTLSAKKAEKRAKRRRENLEDQSTSDTNIAKKAKPDVAMEDDTNEDGGVKLLDEEVPQDPSGLQQNGTQKAGHQPRFTILDALSATGLRALRYAQEIPFASSVTAVDMAKEAIDSMKVNIAYNKLDDKVKPVTGNTLAHMYSFVGTSKEPGGSHKGKYDVVDLDPYGTAAPFLDAAVQAINDGGMLCVTCTDAGVFASCGYPEKAFALYGGTPMKGHHSHEGGLRLILHAIATSAARYGMSIEPLLSLSIDFYVRLFVRIRKSPAEVKFLAGKTMVVYNCDSGCGSWKTQLIGRNDQLQSKGEQKYFKYTLAQGPSCNTHCEHCGFKTHVSGPMYAGPLHNPAFIRAILDNLPEENEQVYMTKERIEGMLSLALEETLVEGSIMEEQTDQKVSSVPPRTVPPRTVPPMDPARVDRHPFFFNTSLIAKVLHAQAPPEAAIRGAIKHAGYLVSKSHAKPNSVRTNAPWEFIWATMREWIRLKPIKEGALRPGMAGWGILHGGDSRKASASIVPKNEALKDEKPYVKNEDEELRLNSLTTASAEAPSKPKWDIVFDEKLGKDTLKKGLVRYQANPRENWGPMNRARG